MKLLLFSLLAFIWAISCVQLKQIPPSNIKAINLFDEDIQKYEVLMTNEEHQKSSSNNLLEINLGYLTGSKRKPYDIEYSRPGLTISGGLTFTLHKLKQQNFFEVNNNLTVKLNVLIGETFGDEEISLRQVAKLWNQFNVSVIIGPQESCLHEAKLAASLNIPMISYFCSDEQPSDKKHFPTFSRTRPPDASISRAVASLILNYGWFHSVVIIFSDSSGDQRFKRVSKSLSSLLKENNVLKVQQIGYRGPYHHGYNENPFEGIVSKTKLTTRIYVVISEYYEHLGLVLAMKKKSLLQNGEYLIIGVSIDDFKEEKWNPTRYFYGLLHDGTLLNKTGLLNTSLDFQSYLGIVASPPKNFTQFSNQVNYFMEQEPFRYPNPLSNIGKNKKIRIEAAYLYDAVALYSQGVRDIIHEHYYNNNTHQRVFVAQRSYETTKVVFSKQQDEGTTSTRTDFISSEGKSLELLKQKIFNGVEISMRLRNLSYKSATGHDTEMDENGDGRGNFTLVSLKKKNGTFGLYPVGFFLRKDDGLPELYLTEPIEWSNNAPPASEPECGFFNEKCESDNTSILFTLITVTILLITSSAIYISFRHWRLRKDIDALMWRIDKREIQWENGQLFSPSSRKCSSTNKSCTSNGSGTNPGTAADTGSQTSLVRFSTIYAPLVTYRERHFAAKKLDIDVFDTSMKQQLQMLREIRHENLNVFIGACHYEDGLLLVNDYCSRGSLKDILENEVIKLEDMFVSSLVGDLLRGLSYLHDSTPIKFHGNLKNTNCLIDSRWVLKLTDFGFIKSGENLSRNNSWKKKSEHSHSILTNTSRNVPTIVEPSVGESSYSLNTIYNSLHHPSITHWRYSHRNNRDRHPSTSNQETCITCTSPYLSPEYPMLISKQVKNVVEGYRRADIYSLGIILWELLRRELLTNYMKNKTELEIREHICQNITFWPCTLQALSNELANSSTTPTPTAATTVTLAPPSPNNFIQRSTSFYKNRRLTLSSGTITATTKLSTKNNNNNYNHYNSQLNINNLATSATMNNNNNLSISAPQVIEALGLCLSFDPNLRPDIKTVRTKLRPLHKGMRSNIFDIMIGLMEKYANNLEILVDERTKQLSEEKRKTESLLYEMIPAKVAEKLKEGHHVPAQNYECVSIFFSDIVGFTSLSAESTPFEVVELLNDLYSCFDSVIENFDVYKVETIGDAYMVASGLPISKEGNFHALEMARMALTLLNTVKSFKIHHRPTEILKLRIGIHSGPVCSGVVGHKRPRYCLFGDTVNVASRMESTGLPLRIHCSQAFASHVQDKFELEARGVVDVKGKGDMMTFWLIQEKVATTMMMMMSTTTTATTSMAETTITSVMMTNTYCSSSTTTTASHSNSGGGGGGTSSSSHTTMTM